MQKSMSLKYESVTQTGSDSVLNVTSYPTATFAAYEPSIRVCVYESMRLKYESAMQTGSDSALNVTSYPASTLNPKP